MAKPPRLTIYLGMWSVIGLVLQALALQDIYHAESDVSLEWAVVRIAYLSSLAFHFLALRALLRQ